MGCQWSIFSGERLSPAADRVVQTSVVSACFQCLLRLLSPRRLLSAWRHTVLPYFPQISDLWNVKKYGAYAGRASVPQVCPVDWCSAFTYWIMYLSAQDLQIYHQFLANTNQQFCIEPFILTLLEVFLAVKKMSCDLNERTICPLDRIAQFYIVTEIR